MAADKNQIIPIQLLQPNPFQPRSIIDEGELQELAASIRVYGILEPIVVAHTPAGFQIIAGERRWRAAKLAGLKEVPAVIKETSPKGMLEMALVENVQRTDLNPLERARAFYQLVNEFRFQVEQLAAQTGKSVPYIRNTIRLLKLPDTIKDGLMEGLISEYQARCLLMVDDKQAMVSLYHRVVKEGLSAGQTEDMARNLQMRLTKPKLGKKARFISADADEIIAWQQSLERLLHKSKPKVHLSRSGVSTRLTITLRGTPVDTDGDLQTILKLMNVSRAKKIK